jgi:hypothetical protein
MLKSFDHANLMPLHGNYPGNINFIAQNVGITME